MEQRKAFEWDQGTTPQVKAFLHDAAQKSLCCHLCRYLLLARRHAPALIISRKEKHGSIHLK